MLGKHNEDSRESGIPSVCYDYVVERCVTFAEACEANFDDHIAVELGGKYSKGRFRFVSGWRLEERRDVEVVMACPNCSIGLFCGRQRSFWE